MFSGANNSFKFQKEHLHQQKSQSLWNCAFSPLATYSHWHRQNTHTDTDRDDTHMVTVVSTANEHRFLLEATSSVKFMIFI